MSDIQPIFESLEYKDLVGMMKPTVHIDEFSSKMGDDDDVIVVSFYLRDAQAAKDLMNWFEKGYDFVLDADRSPGEIKPNRYLVYLEMLRRSTAGAKLEDILRDLETLTEYKLDDWIMHYEGKEQPFSRDLFDQLVPLTPAAYKAMKEKDLNEWRHRAGLDVRPIHERDRLLRQLQNAAGI